MKQKGKAETEHREEKSGNLNLLECGRRPN